MTSTITTINPTDFSTLVHERAQQLFGTMDEATLTRINEEIQVIQNMGLAAEMLTLMHLVGQVKSDLGFAPKPSTGILAGSYAAYCLGIEPSNPRETGAELDPLAFRPPLHLTLVYDNAERNQVADWLRKGGYEVSTYLGQPMLKLPNMRVAIQRSTAVHAGHATPIR